MLNRCQDLVEVRAGLVVVAIGIGETEWFLLARRKINVPPAGQLNHLVRPQRDTFLFPRRAQRLPAAAVAKSFNRRVSARYVCQDG
jgi:hypothetical protein